MTEIYITCLLQILSFSSRFRRFEMKNFLQQPTMVAIIYIIINLPSPHDRIFFIPTGLLYLHLYGEDFQNAILYRKFHHGLEALMSKIIKFTEAFMMQTSHERKTRNK